MIRFLIFMAFCLVAGEVVQMALLPPLIDLMPPLAAGLIALRLMALAGLLAGMLRGEEAGLLAAVAGALLFGFSTDASFLGPALISYGLTAFAAGWLARSFRFHKFGPRWLTLFLLLLFESILWAFVRKMFWTDAPIDFPLLANISTAFFGAAIYPLLAMFFKVNLIEDDGLGMLRY